MSAINKISHGYFSGYKKPFPKKVQVDKLKDLCLELGDNPTVGQWQGNIPKGAEGLFYMINIWRPNSVLLGTYNDQLQWMLDKLKEDLDGNFHNYREGQTGYKYLRLMIKSLAAWKKISRDQGHPDILVVPMQFGLEYRGLSTPIALEIMLEQSQFGPGSFAIGIMLLTHPERLQHFSDLWIDCAGDECYDSRDTVTFGRTPFFRFREGKVNYGARYVKYTSEYCGSVSGFLLQ
jgi:hypothetical protein